MLGSILLAIFLVNSRLIEHSLKIHPTVGQTIVVYVRLFLVLPASVVDDYSIHRLYEIPSLVIFIIALFYFYKSQLYKRKDTFYRGLLGYLIVTFSLK